jgi:hypothetical protein
MQTMPENLLAQFTARQDVPLQIRGMVLAIAEDCRTNDLAVKKFFESLEDHLENLPKLFENFEVYVRAHYLTAQREDHAFYQEFREAAIRGDLFAIGTTYVRAMVNCVTERLDEFRDTPRRVDDASRAVIRRVAHEFAEVMLHLLITDDPMTEVRLRRGTTLFGEASVTQH